jgi:hypothetical protein
MGNCMSAGKKKQTTTIISVPFFLYKLSPEFRNHGFLALKSKTEIFASYYKEKMVIRSYNDNEKYLVCISSEEHPSGVF